MSSSLSILPFVLSLLIYSSLRKSLRVTGLLPKWEKRLKLGLYVAVILIALEAVFKVSDITTWIWNLALIGVVYVLQKEKDFSNSKSLALAILPYVLFSFLDDIVRVTSASLYQVWDGYLESAINLSVVWMVAMWINANRQQKTLAKERERRRQEEEINKVIAARKVELEGLVEERTAELTQQKEELELALTELKATQDQLIQQEKLASLGELTAGIAHEIQNPLNFVNNFSEVSIELLDELETGLNNDDKEEVLAIASDIKQNLQKISQHGKRADSIVKGMLQHSRKSTGQKELTDINALADEYLRLSYHGLRAKDKSFNATLNTGYDAEAGQIEAVPQELGRVVLNIINNAFYSVSEKKKQLGPGFEPAVTVKTQRTEDGVTLTIRDNGTGIPQKVMDKIYQPFFTTKPTGEGTGLGLSLSYDIITKVHGGELQVNTQEGEFAEFIIRLPGPVKNA